MKKRCTTIITCIAVLFLNITVFAGITTNFVVVKTDSGVKVVGNAENKMTKVSLVVSKPGFEKSDLTDYSKAGQMIYYVDQKYSNTDGSFEFNVKMDNIQETADYKVYVLDGADLSSDILNVVEYGADNTGETDSTNVLKTLHDTGKKIYYPNGIYRFNGETLNLSGGVIFESLDGVVVRNDVSEQNILQFDNKGNLIGLMQNHLELDDSVKGNGWKMNVGSLVPPPVSDADYETKVDFIPIWYNDFGLEYTRASQYLWKGWYYWNWNFHSNISSDPKVAYDPDRHPLLGFYRGDDATVLDWQCYWLKEYGAKATILISNSVSGGIASAWSSESNKNYWIYQLFNNVPNFRKLKYIMSLCPAFPPVDGTSDELKQSVIEEWNNTINSVYNEYDNYYYIEKNGKKYPVVYVHQEGALIGVFDNYNGALNTGIFYKGIADKFQEHGFGGVALFVRQPNSVLESNRSTLEQNGVLRYTMNYGPSYFSDMYSDPDITSPTYSDIVNYYRPTTADNHIVNTFTGYYTHSPHPSGWNAPGQTPELFNKMINKAIEHIYQNNMPRIVTCYNVAEWAEGGPGLQPTVKNRFGYLEAVKDAIIEKQTSKMVSKGKDVTGGGVSLAGTDTSQYLTDGNMETVCAVSAGESNWTTPTAYPRSFIIDLGGRKNIEKIKLYPAIAPYGSMFPQRFKIDVSDYSNFSTFTTVYDSSSSDYYDISSPPVNVQEFNTGISGRYIRINALKHGEFWFYEGQNQHFYYFALAEAEIYAKPQFDLNISCVTQSGNVITDSLELPKNEAVTLRAVIQNSGEYLDNAKLLIGMYDDNKLENVLSVNAALNPGQTTIEHVISPEQLDGCNNISVMLWDKFDSMNPLSIFSRFPQIIKKVD